MMENRENDMNTTFDKTNESNIGSDKGYNIYSNTKASQRSSNFEANHYK